MSAPKRYRVTVDPHGDGWAVQAHHLIGDEVIGSGHLYERSSIAAAMDAAEALVRHRQGAGKSCVLVLSPEAQEANT